MRRLLSNRRGMLAGAAAAIAALHGLRAEVVHAAALSGDSNTVGVSGVTGTHTLSVNDATGVYGVATSTTGGVVGVWGRTSSSSSNARGVYGECTNASSLASGVYGRIISTQNNASGVSGEAAGATGETFGVFGQTLSSTLNASGVKGQALSGVTNGVWGRNVSGANGATGVYGEADNLTTLNHGVFGRSKSTNINANGVYGEVTGSNAQGSGVRGRSIAGNGVRGDSTSGVGVQGSSISSYGLAGASTTSFGLVGASSQAIGVYGRGGTVGIYGVPINPGGFAAQFNGNVVIQGSLTVTGSYPKSAAVKKRDGTQARMYCMESPESWFEDFGTAELKQGQATVDLDPEFDQVVKGDDYRVFLTPIGVDCSLYVSRKGPHRFDVRTVGGALKNGTFDFRVVARRFDNVGKRMEKVVIPPTPDLDLTRVFRTDATPVPPVPPKR